MNLWTQSSCENYSDKNTKIRTGLRLRIDKNVDYEVRESIKKFAKWLRHCYKFPVRLPVYVKATEYIKTQDGDNVVGSFFEPYDLRTEPYIRIATGDYKELKKFIGRDNALVSIIYTLSHEITHYHQWKNGLEMTIEERKQQADCYGDYILEQYAGCVDYP